MKLHIKELKTTFLLLLLLSSSSIFAANRYWVANAASNWNNTANWSTGSGGAGGASVPVAGDFVYFNASGTGNCTLDVNAAFDGIKTTGYTGVIDFVGFTFNPATSGSANCEFRSGTINGTSALSFTTTGYVYFYTTTFNVDINITAGWLAFNGGVYNNPVEVVSAGAANVNGVGGCTFNDTFKVTTSGTNYFLMASTNPDVFNGDVTLINNGSSRIRMAYNSVGNQFNGNITVGSTAGTGVWIGEGASSGSTLANTKQILIDGGGFSAGDLRFRNFVQTGTTVSNLSLTGTAMLRYDDCTFDSDVNVDAPRIIINGSTFNGLSDFEKTGAANDMSIGGNSFQNNCILTNSGSGYLAMGNGNPDVFTNNLTLNNTGTHNIYLAYNSAGNSIGGDFTINNSAQSTVISDNTVSTLSVAGNCTATNNSALASSIIYLGNFGDITFNGSLNMTNNATGDYGQIILAYRESSTVSVSGATAVSNSGAGIFKYIYLGYSGDVTFNGTLAISNACSAANSHIYCNQSSTSSNLYNENITVEVTNAACDGVFFGYNTGVGTLAANKTITIAAGGVTAGYLYFRNFTQIGATNQTLLCTGTARLENYNSTWGGNVDFRAPQIYTRDTEYKGTTLLEKTGATNNSSSGGNKFIGNLQMINSGSSFFLMGGTNPDTALANVDLINSGTNNLYYAYNSAGNYIAGNLTGANNGSGTSNNLYISHTNTPSIQIDGNCTITNTSSANSSSLQIGGSGTFNCNGNVALTNAPSGTNGSIYLANSAVATIGGTLNITNAGTADNQYAYIANNTTSSITINGNTTLDNSGANLLRRIYLGNQGDVTCNGTLAILNSSSANNSQVYCNHGSNSTGLYNEDITVENTNAAGDGVYFGNGGGSATLAATKTVTISAGGFVAGELRFRNFTQVGPTNHSLLATGTAIIYNYDSDWGGNVDFRAPRMYSRGTRYRGTAILEKTGVGGDYSIGGNHFVGDFQMINSGSGIFSLGSTTPDTCLANLDIRNVGTSSLYYANSSVGNTIAGDLDVQNSGSGTSNNIYIGNSSGASVAVAGNCTSINNSSATNSQIRFGNSGPFSCGGNFTSSNVATGTNGYLYYGVGGDFSVNGNFDIVNGGTARSYSFLAYSTTSNAVINGNTTVLNSGGGPTKQIYLGRFGNTTFNGTLAISNTSSATSSQVYCNTNSSGLFNENITVENTDPAGRGVFFGINGGDGTLAATKTITISAGGFVAGQLYFRNFTQVGPTNHTLLATGTALIYNFDSDWGGNVDFRAPRMITRGTLYRGTAVLEKTGAVANDLSIGGNVFTGDFQMINSGSNYFGMGQTTPDTCLSNLDILNSGTSHIYYAYNSVGNTIAGNVTVLNSGTGASNTTYLGYTGTPSVEIGGNCTADNSSTGNYAVLGLGYNGDFTCNGNLTGVNNGSGTNSYLYLGRYGTTTIGGTLNLTNSSACTGTSEISVARYTSSDITIGGATTVLNTGASTTKRIYFGYDGDITLNGTLAISNSSSASNSQVNFNFDDNSVGTYNENITVENTNAAGDGVFFGASNGTGTLAATKTITISAGGFVAGDLYFRNFTQTGPTNHSLLATGTARIFNYDSDWGGDVNFVAPRIYNRGTVYNGTSYFEKTGSVNDDFYGGNTYVGNAEFKLNNNVANGRLILGSGAPSTFGADLTLKNTGSYDHVYFGNTAGAFPVAGDLTIENSSTGLGSQYIYYLNNAGASSTIAGNATILNNSTGATGAHRILFAYNGNTTINGNTTVTNTGGGTDRVIYLATVGNLTLNGNFDMINSPTASSNGQIRIAENSSSSVTIGGNTTLNHSASGTQALCYLGYSGDVTFNGDLDMINNASGTNSTIALNNRSTSANAYNGNITLTSINANSDGYTFGASTGVGTLAATKTISIPGGGVANFTSGQLYLRNFTQLSATPQTLALAPTADRIYNFNSIWNGDVDFRAPRHYTYNSTYNGTSFLEKNGALNDQSNGGNIFNGNATLKVTGIGYFMPSAATANDFNANATYIKTGTGAMYPAYNVSETYAGDITVDANSTIRFGGAGGGRIIMDGTIAQSINTIGATPTPEFRDLQTINPNAEITLNTPIIILKELDLDQGNIVTTPTNLLYMNDNTTVSSVSNAAYVDGPVEKIGNDTFTFPVGNNGYYRPISMDNPASSSARFRATYFDADPHNAGYHDGQREAGLGYISDCEYWTLDRIAGTNNVKVKLHFESYRAGCSGVTDPSLLQVARWDATDQEWKNHGNGAFTATTIETSGDVTSFSPFTFASLDLEANPLPIELINFNAKRNNKQVDLEWATASEINNDYFTIERSADGVHFYEILTQQGAGNSTAVIDYNDVDYAPLSGVSYYRLKQTDFDGKYTYSDVRVIEITANGSLSIYPNPASNNTYFTISNANDEQKIDAIKIIDNLGKVCKVINAPAFPLDINTQDLSKGLYFVNSYSSDGMISQKLVIQ